MRKTGLVFREFEGKKLSVALKTGSSAQMELSNI